MSTCWAERRLWVTDVGVVSLPPAIAFVARSGTGKTTLMTAVIEELKTRGYRVGAIKHNAHRFTIDRPGKDSYRFTEAGADTMLISSDTQLALVKQQLEPPSVEALLSRYFLDVDLVLVEGFKTSSLPKIELYRAACRQELLCAGGMSEQNLLAVASDVELVVDVPLLDLNRPVQVTDFIVEKLKLKRYK